MNDRAVDIAGDFVEKLSLVVKKCHVTFGATEYLHCCGAVAKLLVHASLLHSMPFDADYAYTDAPL